ncbi:hypothetical protein PCANC_04405 [Puccinia coronata f. sp. avenae]|uniref:Uncharacterized protein n=1 Tax=Puccinia coronata f. sp. avenae TaxID=200324 RepID=A0A2N5T902_9BASI|nr:hypothetical protein PCANC_04405 [Puccinia coronata f. sp. avenae]
MEMEAEMLGYKSANLLLYIVANSTLLIRHIAKNVLLHPAILLPSPAKMPLHGTQPTPMVLSYQDSQYCFKTSGHVLFQPPSLRPSCRTGT